MKKQDQNNKGEIIIYKTKGKISLYVKLEKETIWLNQKQISELFSKNIRTINEHIKNIFKSDELEKKQTIRKFRIVQKEGKKLVERKIDFYNLDMIIAVGYRVNSKRATQFRIWATKVLKDHIIKGFTINQKRLKETSLKEFEQAVFLIKKTIESKKLNTKEAKGLLKVITDYANAWILLHKYDEGKLRIEKTTKIKQTIDYEEASKIILELKNNLIKKKQASDLFGTDTKNGLQGILRTINQTFDKKELYPSIEEKSAHLLYFIIKDHVFTDGNKRIGSFLFIVFLAKNSYLFNKKGEKKFNDNALVALALLIAQSNPKEKDTMIKLIINFLIN